MANTEYSDLPFVSPAAFGAGRPAPPRVIVIHYTAGSERSTSAEDGAAYDQRRTDGTSTHYFVDSDSVVQCVYTWDRANAALYNGNRIGIQYELCGTQQTRAQWLDPASDATLTNAARQAARDAKKYGIPVRKLTPAQVRAGERGFCGHADITLAYPEDGGDHMDPGAEFPWDVFLARVQQFIGGDMSALAEQQISTILDIVGATADGREATWNGSKAIVPNRWHREEVARDAAEATAIAGLKAAVDAMAAAIAAGGGSVDVATITAAIDAKTGEVRTLVEQRHAEEMAALQAERAAEVAALQAQLVALHVS